MVKQVKKSIRRAKGKGPFMNPIAVNRARKIEQLKNKTSKVKRDRASPRLYMKGVFANFPRGKNHSNTNSALLRIDNVNTKDDAEFYIGKRCCWVYHGQKERKCVRWSKAPARRSTARAIRNALKVAAISARTDAIGAIRTGLERLAQ